MTPVLFGVLLCLSVGCAPTAQSKPAGRPASAPRRLPAVPAPKPQPVASELNEAARKEITAAARSRDPLVRAHALESIRQLGGSVDNIEILRGLSDPEPVVRFAAAMAAGELGLADAHQSLLKLVNDPDRTVQIAARFGLHRIGDKRFSHDFERTARDPETIVRADTAIALGLLQEPSAVKVLREMQFDGSPSVRLQAAEALWRYGVEDALKTLVGATLSAFADDQAVAYLALAGPRNPKVMSHIHGGLSSEYTQIQLIAARAAGMLGSDAGYPIALTGAKSEDAVQRALAAFAFGAIGRTDAQPVLAQLLKDTDPDVRLAAATAVLQLREGT